PSACAPRHLHSFPTRRSSDLKNMRYVTVEQEALGGAVFQYPRGKLVMTAPATVPLIGKVNFRQTSKEALLEFWKDAERRTGIKIDRKSTRLNSSHRTISYAVF